MHCIDPRIQLTYLQAFLTYEETQDLFDFARYAAFEPSSVLEGLDVRSMDHRTSSTYYFPRDSPAVSAILIRAAVRMNLPKENIEAIQLVRYRPGEYFRPHYDWFYNE